MGRRDVSGRSSPLGSASSGGGGAHQQAHFVQPPGPHHSMHPVLPPIPAAMAQNFSNMLAANILGQPDGGVGAAHALGAALLSHPIGAMGHPLVSPDLARQMAMTAMLMGRMAGINGGSNAGAGASVSAAAADVAVAQGGGQLGQTVTGQLHTAPIPEPSKNLSVVDTSKGAAGEAGKEIKNGAANGFPAYNPIQSTAQNSFSAQYGAQLHSQMQGVHAPQLQHGQMNLLQQQHQQQQVGVGGVNSVPNIPGPVCATPSPPSSLPQSAPVPAPMPQQYQHHPLPMLVGSSVARPPPLTATGRRPRQKKNSVTNSTSAVPLAATSGGAVLPNNVLSMNGFPPLGAPGGLGGFMRGYRTAAAGGPAQRAAAALRFKQGKLRRGKWTPEEENYANRLIVEFEKGSIPDCDNGCTLRLFLSRKLNCQPMRISKKFAGKSIGKYVYLSRRGGPAVDKLDTGDGSIRVETLEDLEHAFYQSLLREGVDTGAPNSEYSSVLTNTINFPALQHQAFQVNSMFPSLPQVQNFSFNPLDANSAAQVVNPFSIWPTNGLVNGDTSKNVAAPNACKPEPVKTAQNNQQSKVQAQNGNTPPPPNSSQLPMPPKNPLLPVDPAAVGANGSGMMQFPFPMGFNPVPGVFPFHPFLAYQSMAGAAQMASTIQPEQPKPPPVPTPVHAPPPQQAPVAPPPQEPELRRNISMPDFVSGFDNVQGTGRDVPALEESNNRPKSLVATIPQVSSWASEADDLAGGMTKVQSSGMSALGAFTSSFDDFHEFLGQDVVGSEGDVGQMLSGPATRALQSQEGNGTVDETEDDCFGAISNPLFGPQETLPPPRIVQQDRFFSQPLPLSTPVNSDSYAFFAQSSAMAISSSYDNGTSGNAPAKDLRKMRTAAASSNAKKKKNTPSSSSTHHISSTHHLKRPITPPGTMNAANVEANTKAEAEAHKNTSSKRRKRISKDFGNDCVEPNRISDVPNSKENFLNSTRVRSALISGSEGSDRSGSDNGSSKDGNVSNSENASVHSDTPSDEVDPRGAGINVNKNSLACVATVVPLPYRSPSLPHFLSKQ